MSVDWYFYIVSNGNHTLYAGMAADLIETRAAEQSWPRARKIALVESKNPEWRDLSVSCEDVLRF
jgi:predicted GIY-YIG superfamily endonuclease